MNRLRHAVGKLTSPIFVPLRRLIVWLDDRLGTCDHRLVLEPRPCNIDLPRPSERSVRISELQAKISKDKANLHGLGEDVPNEYRNLV